jgi:hypothetical protein
MLTEKINNILIHDPDRANQFQELANYQKEHYPLCPNIDRPKDLPIKDVLPDYIDPEINPEIVREMRQTPHRVRRSRGW